MDQAVSGLPPWPVAWLEHGTVMARCPIWPSSPRRPATANISAAQEARSPARLPPIPHSLPASPIPNPNPHSLSLARSRSALDLDPPPPPPSAPSSAPVTSSALLHSTSLTPSGCPRLLPPFPLLSLSVNYEPCEFMFFFPTLPRPPRRRF